MGRALGSRPKSIVLIALLHEHGDALAYDWRVRFGVELRDDLNRLGWSRMWAYAQRILADPYSHTASVVRGDKYVPDPAEVAGHRLMEFIRQMMRGKNQIVQHQPGPWEGAQLAGGSKRVLTDEQRAEHKRELEALTGVTG